MLMKRLLVLVAALLGMLAYAGLAQAATATFSGTAVIEGDHVKIVSDFLDDPGNTANNGGAVAFTDTGVSTFSSLSTLSAEFNVTDDACLGGSPRFEVDFAGTDDNLFIYLGGYNPTTGQFDCVPNTWIDSGNLIGVTEPRFDTSKFAGLGGTFYDTYAHALAILGGMTIDEIRFVADGGWAFSDKEQTVLLRTATVNSSTSTFQAPPATLNPARACRALRAQVGRTDFMNEWGTNTNKRNAFGKCVSHMAKLKRQSKAAAQAICAGTNGKAHARCVRSNTVAQFATRRAELVTAVDTCSTELKADRGAFLEKYGKGKKRNVKAAFAACVRSKD
jgi:hypothetical protein